MGAQPKDKSRADALDLKVLGTPRWVETKDEQERPKERKEMLYLIPLNFSSASGDGFLSGWYCGGMNDIGGEVEFQKEILTERQTFIAALRYAFLSSVSFTSVGTLSWRRLQNPKVVIEDRSA